MFIKDLKKIDNGTPLYRGLVPFFAINNNDSRIIYVSSSNKNLEDYYFVIKDFYNGTLLKIESINVEKEEINGKKEKMIELINSDEKFIILMSTDGALLNYSNEINKLEIKKGKEYSIKSIITYLEDEGYEKNYLIEKRGQYSVRGDILDIFSTGNDYPVRIEFFDNIVENIRLFDIDTQKSVDKIEKTKIYSNNPKNQNLSLTDLIKEKNVKIYFENSELVKFRTEEFILLNREDEDKLRRRYSDIIELSEKIEIKNFEGYELDRFKDYDNVKELAEKGKVVIMSDEDMRYKEIFKSCDNVEIEKYPYFEGFRYENIIYLTDRELKGIKIRRVEKRKEGIKVANAKQLRNGDYIIHRNYGVGIFLGLADINSRDYITIQYAGEDKLYVPIEHIGRIEKYIFDVEKIPEIFKLGRKGFKKKSEKLREEIEKFARELVEIQAKRKLASGYKFGADTLWQEEFEESFPYNETPGQLKAIIEVKEDMESEKVMDRIICGDVGFGKTEVALRAAFKAADNGKQVAILAPTTVLVNQHYERFTERFKNFPFKIEMISRIISDKKQTELKKELKSGAIDIIIGTHALLAEGIKFNDLGLLIIDEEQKFGVKHKEKFKGYRNNIDILTLTATPIPRTLNMAMMGIRDISIIDTPPENKLPVETVFVNYNEEKIREAVLREVARDGQVFYVYNRVESIENKVEEIKKILPEYIKISYAHGQMESHVIKNRMDDFRNRVYDIMVTTTIIENGIDMENVNTMIIDEYDKMGMSQIYQLRGRVGRGNRKAYCYLLHKKNSLTKKGKEKVETLKNMNDLGAGFELSLEDMRIRGVGDVLGEKQHGLLEEMGYDLYLKMVEDEVKRIRGQKVAFDNDSLMIDIINKGYIPDTYIIEREKIKIYKRLIDIADHEILDEMEKEVEDRFGKMPQEVISLFNYLRLKIDAASKGIEHIKEEENGYKIKISENSLEIEKINMLLLKGKIKYLQKEQAVFLEKSRQSLEDFIKNL